MTVVACLTHWYISMLYVVPVLAVGGWGWWSSKRSTARSRQAKAVKAAARPSGTSASPSA
jgi:hypothetical protein